MGDFKKLLAASKKIFNRVALFSMFTNLLMLTLPIYMLQIFDRVLPSKSEDTLLYLTLIALAIIGVFVLFNICRSQLLNSLSFWLDRELSTSTLKRAPDDILQGDDTGSSMLQYSAHLRGYLSSGVFLILFDIPWIPIFLLAIFLLNFWIGWLAVVGAIILFALALINDVYTRPLYKTANLTQAASQVNINGILKNADTIQSMGMGDAMLSHWERFNAKTHTFLRTAGARSNVFSSISKGVRLGLQIMILCVGAYLVTQDKFTPGMMIACSILMSRAVAPVEQSIGAWREFVKAKQEYEGLKEYVNKPLSRVTTIDLPEPKGEIKVEHLFFRYPSLKEWTLLDINLTFNPGELVVIAGPSASGKSTFLRLLAGTLRPMQGHVRLDNAEVYFWDRKQFGRYVGYMAQTIELFNSSVKDNIARMEEVDETKVVHAAELANAHELILKLQNGYDTLIGEQGKNISGGQRQYIALARSLYHVPRVLLLDEPTSFMDERSQRVFIQTLSNLKSQGVTIVMVTHKPAVISIADKLVFMQNGKVLSAGPTQEVLDQLKQYANETK